LRYTSGLRSESSLIEELVPDDELRRLGLASRDATCAVRCPPLTS
jgi:hypothetical protein